MIRISVSDLESWRYWKASETADMADLIARLRHESPLTPAMEAGRALAKFFEHATEGDLDAAKVDGWEFVFALDAQIAVPLVRELKAEVVFDTPSGLVTLVGKVDGLHGTAVHDQKLTENFDAERYLDSLQWRSYLVMFGATTFVYDVLVGRYSGNTVTITDYHRLPFYAYPDMRRDVQRAVEELAEVIVRYVPTKEAA